jgi:hypothetical protein
MKGPSPTASDGGVRQRAVKPFGVAPLTARRRAQEGGQVGEGGVAGVSAR